MEPEESFCGPDRPINPCSHFRPATRRVECAATCSQPTTPHTTTQHGPQAMTQCSYLKTLPKIASRIFTTNPFCGPGGSGSLSVPPFCPSLYHSSRTTPARNLTHRHLAYEKYHAGLANTTITTYRSLTTRPKINVIHINIIHRSMTTRTQPPWTPPKALDNVPPLKIYNSLTRQKNAFYPIKENEVSWYSCGPTLYSDSHQGHGRNFVTTDILRRILSDYFNYKVNFGRWS
jgi:hypothetical protein